MHYDVDSPLQLWYLLALRIEYLDDALVGHLVFWCVDTGVFAVEKKADVAYKTFVHACACLWHVPA